MLWLLLLPVFGQLLDDGELCNIDEDCSSDCCFRLTCYPNDNCDMYSEFFSDEQDPLTCDVDGDCESGCCQLGECKSRGWCILTKELPIILAALIALCCFICCLLCICLYVTMKINEQ